MSSRHLLNHAMRVGIFALAASLGSAGIILAGDDDDDDRDQKRPPQVLKRGFESTDQLLDDIERAERGQAFGVDRRKQPFPECASPRVPARRRRSSFVDLPVNVGIIKAPNGDITLYDAGWKQLAYIFDWNTSCCWSGIRQQMEAIGLDPNRVVRIIIGHGHWDHAGQLSEFPNAVLYVQKEEPSRSISSSTIPLRSTTATSAPSTRSTRSPARRSDRRHELALAARFAAIRRRCRRSWARSSPATRRSSTAGTKSPRG